MEFLLTLFTKMVNLLKVYPEVMGYTGEDILENLRTIKNLPKKILSNNIPNLLEIRCEVYISKSDFVKFKR